jgi:4-diphosphocytidyl-2-C-methyl-D-erythritol kinase
VISFPNSKINLGLNIVSKRHDGFHNIETCIYPIPFRDILEIVPAYDRMFEFFTTGIDIPHDGKPNLCERAYHVLNCQAVKIFLHKVISPGTGLGAGSSNAACTLVMLNKMFGLGLTNEELKEKALLIGSDCPFFIENKPAIAIGRGEVLEPVKIDLSGIYLALFTPNVHVSTSLAYSLIKPQETKISIREIVKLPLKQWKGLLKNDFEPVIFEMNPVLSVIKQLLYERGAIYASMSGSGSAIYGLFENDPKLESFKGFKPIVFRLLG